LRANGSRERAPDDRLREAIQSVPAETVWIASELTLLAMTMERQYPLVRQQCFGYHRSMKAGPDIAMVASLVGDPARANMLTALMSGRALTASELAQEAGITPQTASSHLAKLEAGGLVEPEKQGRHRYYRLTGEDVAGVLEMLEGLAARVGHMRVRTGPKDPALRRARICYDHLAGDLGVQMLDSMRTQRLVRQKKQDIELTPEGTKFLERNLQISPDMLSHPRRPVCKACLDWSERRHHLAGTLGTAMMTRFAELKWAARDTTAGSRVVNFTRAGEKRFTALFPHAEE
jgi:DNA-binding transcriptional ArsR family regulator